MIKKYLLDLDKCKTNLQNAIIDLKIATHDLDKMGLNVGKIYKQIDELGIEFTKLKSIINNEIKERLEDEKNECK